MRIISNVCYGKYCYHEQYLDMYLPDKDSFKVVVYMHGGGIENGDKCSAKAVGEYLADKGIAFVSINYRMYPQAVYPQFINDAAEAVCFVYKNIGKYGECEGIYIGGSSAGGYLSAVNDREMFAKKIANMEKAESKITDLKKARNLTATRRSKWRQL